MAIPEAEFKRKVEEFKELGHEYRYREQLMVQEFSLAMVAIAALLNVILKTPPPSTESALLMQLFGSLFLPLLALHLRNINQDRRAALHRKDELRKLLEFEEVHQNISGRTRVGAPRLIVWFARVTAIVWVTWTVVSFVQVLKCA